MASVTVKPKEVAFPAEFKLYGQGGGATVASKDQSKDSQTELRKSGQNISKKLKVEVVNQQTKLAPQPPKQPKYIVNPVSSKALDNDISRIVSCVSKGQRSNIDELTKGHLNERHLFPKEPPQLGDPYESKWPEHQVKQVPKSKNNDTPKQRKQNAKAQKSEKQYNKMSLALHEFVMRTTGANEMLSKVYEENDKPKTPIPKTSSAKYRNSVEKLSARIQENTASKNNLISNSNRESEFSEDLGIYDADSSLGRISDIQEIRASMGSRWNDAPQVEEIKPGELKLPKIETRKKPSQTPPPLSSPGKKNKFLVSHFYGATKKDQYNGLIGFQNSVMNFDSNEVKMVSNSLAAKYYKDKLKKLLTSLPSKTYRATTPTLDKVFAHGTVWEDLIKDSPIFGPVLQAIKNEYESYLRQLAVNERRKVQSGSLHSEITGLLTGTGVSASGEVVINEAGASSQLEADQIEEEEQRNNYMEEEIDILLQNNRSIHEEIKSAKRRLEARKQSKIQSLIEPDGNHPIGKESEKMSQADRIIGLKEEILDTMSKIEDIQKEIKNEMVPAVLTKTIEGLIQDDKKKIDQYSELCEKIIEMSTETGKEFNQNLSKAVISPFEIKMLWRKLKTMNVVGKYTLTNCMNERPIMSSEDNRTSSEIVTEKVIEKATNIEQSDIDAVIFEQEDEDEKENKETKPESSRREDFDFYF